jgi:hypothetical protein
MRTLFVATLATVLTLAIALDVRAQAPKPPGRYIGNYSTNPYAPEIEPQPRGTFTNPYGNSSNSPRLYDSHGRFRGNLNTNQYDRDSVANPYGRYGSKYSEDSINNPYGAGSPYNEDSPSNRFGDGLRIYSPD